MKETNPSTSRQTPFTKEFYVLVINPWIRARLAFSCMALFIMWSVHRLWIHMVYVYKYGRQP